MSSQAPKDQGKFCLESKIFNPSNRIKRLKLEYLIIFLFGFILQILFTFGNSQIIDQMMLSNGRTVLGGLVLLLQALPTMQMIITPAPVPPHKRNAALEPRRGGGRGGGGGGGGGYNYYAYSDRQCAFMASEDAVKVLTAGSNITNSLSLSCNAKCAYSSNYVGCYYTTLVSVSVSTITRGFYTSCIERAQWSAAGYSNADDILVCAGGYDSTSCQEFHFALATNVFTTFSCVATGTTPIPITGGALESYKPTITGNVTIENLFYDAIPPQKEDDSDQSVSGFFKFVDSVGGWVGFGCIIGAIVIVLLGGCIGWKCYRRHKRRKQLRGIPVSKW